MSRLVPELLAPAGSLDAVRAALANGANAIYLGAEKFNARDDGAQLTLDDLAQACALAHPRGVRIYLTFNVLFKPSELREALLHLGECIDRGIDAAIVQDVGAVRLIQQVYPGFEIHGSTQMTVHDAAGARVLRELGVDRVVLARENTLDDIRAIRAAVPGLGLESFVHGALCIAYSGQCFMSGMISERSANRGSCAQSCRKDYVLTDVATHAELDRGYLISAKDLAAYDHLAEIAEAGIGCLKIEGRKKKPEYVATVTHGYRDFLDRLASDTWNPPTDAEVQPLIQIFSRGFTGGMYGGRAGREYVTRGQSDNRGAELGTVLGTEGRELVLSVSHPIAAGDGLGFEHPDGPTRGNTGFTVTGVRNLGQRKGRLAQAIPAERHVPEGWIVVRSSHAALLDQARDSYASVEATVPKAPMDIVASGSSGTPLTLAFAVGGETVRFSSPVLMRQAEKRPLDVARLREQIGRLGETPFILRSIDASALSAGLFLPISILNDLRQEAVAELLRRKETVERNRRTRRETAIDAALVIDRYAVVPPQDVQHSDRQAAETSHRDPATTRREEVLQSRTVEPLFRLTVEVWRLEDALAAAEAGATEISLDLFLRHPIPPVGRVRTLIDSLAERGVTLRLRTPTIVRPEERRNLDKWLALDTPLVSGHLGLVAELAQSGRDVVADYAVNCFNQHTAREIFNLGAKRIVLSIELTGVEMAEVAAPWDGEGFDVFAYGRPEGMTLEHCVLSAAFDREVATCRDLCVQKHPNVELTDPAGYRFPVATDSACRNRLLHSRPVDASEYLPSLWRSGIRNYRLVFNVPGDPVSDVTIAYHQILTSLATGRSPDPSSVRSITGGEYTRGHFARAV